MLRATGALLIAGSLCAAAAADTIHLKSGGVLRNARVLHESGATVTVELRIGKRRAQVVVASRDILRIEFDAPPEPARTPDGRPRRPDRLIKAFALLQQMRPVEAEVALQPFLTDKRWQAEARYGLALAHEQTGDLDASAKQQRLAALLDPKHPWVRFHGAHLTHRHGKFAAAISGYTRALALDPENPRLRAAVREAIAAAKAGHRPADPADQRRRRDDAASGTIGDAAAAATAVRTNPQLELRAHITGLRVLLDVPPGAVQAYVATGDATAFRNAVRGVRAVVTAGESWRQSAAADRRMCLRQIHSALGHRYPNAVPIVEAFDATDTKQLVGAAWFHGERVLTRLFPEPAGE
ncbi:MAG: tetratricopeptide repeat protein [Planctomycetota bacterium]